jgi:hypothetical protein
MDIILDGTFYLATALRFGIFTLSTPSYASSSEALYVQDGHPLITYGVNPKTAVAKKLGSPPRSSMYSAHLG